MWKTKENLNFGVDIYALSIYNSCINKSCVRMYVCVRAYNVRSRKATTAASAELDVKYKRLRRVDGHAWRTKRSGISRERYPSMREPSVSPRRADAVGSLSRGNGGRGNT